MKADTSFDALARDIGVDVRDRVLWEQALTHRSFAHEFDLDERHNERLEFLGDAVIELAVREYMYEKFPDRSEGHMAQMATSLVRSEALADAADRLNLSRYMRLGRGEERSGGRQRLSLLENVFEAVVAAVYLERGWNGAKHFVMRALKPAMNELEDHLPPRDAKSMLQEKLQARYKKVPSYRLVDESGPDHERVFFSEVVFDDKTLGRGQGRSRKSAEQAAAEDALAHWDRPEDDV